MIRFYRSFFPLTPWPLSRWPRDLSGKWPWCWGHSPGWWSLGQGGCRYCCTAPPGGFLGLSWPGLLPCQSLCQLLYLLSIKEEKNTLQLYVRPFEGERVFITWSEVHVVHVYMYIIILYLIPNLRVFHTLWKSLK